MKNEDRKREINQVRIWAQALLADPGTIIIDTETSGLTERDVVIEIAIIRASTAKLPNQAEDRVLLNTLVRLPIHDLYSGYVTADAMRIHGISSEETWQAPEWPDVWPEARRIIENASRVVTWNTEFDLKMLRQTCAAHGIDYDGILIERFEHGSNRGSRDPVKWQCAMKQYAVFVGELRSSGEYKYQRLGGAHRALSDCWSVMRKLRTMAKS